MTPGIAIKYFRSLLTKHLTTQRLVLAQNKRLVLTYHRVLPKTKLDSFVEPGMYVTPATLHVHIRYLKKHFKIISVDQLIAYSDTENGAKPICVLTFDDGWVDFYRYAWPILQAEGVPAVVYLPTALIGTEESFWTDRLQRLLALDDGRDALSRHFNIKFGNNTERAIASLKGVPIEQIVDSLSVCEELTGSVDGVEGRSFMNWDEVRELYSTGMVHFGSHTVHHAIVTTLAEENIYVEVKKSMEMLRSEKVVGKNVSFCYPNGNYSRKISGIVRDAGYLSAMTCDSGWNDNNSDPFSLKRVSMHQDVSFSESLFVYRLNQLL